MKTVKAFAPATVANVAVGFDILGFALESMGDTVTATLKEDPGVEIAKIAGAANISTQSDQNTASVAVAAFLAEVAPEIGVSLKIKKGIPLSSGLGGSAASAVAAVFAANHLLNKPLSPLELYPFCVEGEKVASQSYHGDNVGPSLLGGMILVAPTQNLLPLKLNLKGSYFATLFHPEMEIETKSARQLLKPDISLKEHVQQAYFLGAFLHGLSTRNTKLISETCVDILIEPQRKHLIPYFSELKSAAMEVGALGFSISGSGPTLFALSSDFKTAKKIQKSLSLTYRELGGKDFQCWVSPIAKTGAKIIK